MNVLEFIEQNGSASSLPQLVTVKRTAASKYLFYTLVRHYRLSLRTYPQFIFFNKSSANSYKGMMEEIPLFSGGFYVLEGFPLSLVKGLNLPKGVFVLAEVDDGELEAPPYGYKVRRSFIKILCAQLGYKAPLREMVSLDWGGVRDYPELEVLVRKASVADWPVHRLGEELDMNAIGNVLLLLKKGNIPELLALKSKYTESWLFRFLMKAVPQLATYRSLVLMNQQPQAIAEVLGLSSYKLRELEEAAKAVSMSDLKVLGSRILELDKIFSKNPSLATDLLLMRSGISLKR